MSQRINWHARILAAERRELHWDALADTAIRRALRRGQSRRTVAAYFRAADHYAWLADQARLTREKSERGLYNQMQRYQKSLQRKTVVIPASKAPSPREYIAVRGTMSAEWEFGFEYDAKDRDRSHDVDVNFHVRRKDGKPFSKDEARAVMYYVAKHRGEIPPGYEIAAVDWRSPWRSTRWKRGSEREVLSGPLVNVLDTMADQVAGWRLGNPKWEE